MKTTCLYNKPFPLPKKKNKNMSQMYKSYNLKDFNILLLILH